VLKRLFPCGIARDDLKKPSVIILILVNLYPIFGALFLDWEIFPVLLLYWTENIAIGVINVLKMILATPSKRNLWAAKLFMVPFFCIHYGGFTLGHGVFIFGLFSRYADFFDFQTMFQVIGDYHLSWGILSIFISHSASFYLNYIKNKEYQEADLAHLMMQPYGRVIFLHVVTILGGFLVAFLNAPAGLLILLVLAKIVVDVLVHLRQHQK